MGLGEGCPFVREVRFRVESGFSIFLVYRTLKSGVNNIANGREGVRREIAEVVQHPDFYKPIDWNNDISLVRMDQAVQFSEYIKPICLPPPDLLIPNGTPCVVSGWGRSRKGGKISDKLQEQVKDFGR